MTVARLVFISILLFFSFGIALHAEKPGATQSGLRAGAAKRSIVPPFPTRLGGYFDRTETFQGVKSPVFARALVCENDETSTAVLATDLLWMPRNLADAVRRTAAEKTPLEAENILVCAAHNHSAPAGFAQHTLFGGPFNEALFDFLHDALVQTLVEAHSNLRPAHIGFDSGELPGFSRNRHQNNDEVVDREVGVLRVNVADSREVIATLFNFTGHPVILGSGNLFVCGEYPGEAERFVEDNLGGVALFTQGACGDVTVHRSGDPYLEVERLGRILGAEVVKTAETTRPVEDDRLFSRLEDVAVQPRVFATLEEAREKLEGIRADLSAAEEAGAGEAVLARLKRDLDSAEWAVRLANLVKDRPEARPALEKAPVHVMQIGPLALVGIPGELFVEYGLEMKRRVRQNRDLPLIVVGFANDYLGYLVTPRAVHTGGYEQATARLEASAPRAMTEAAMQWIDEGVR